MANSNPVCVWDFTIPEKAATSTDIRELLRRIAKSWAFQLEQGETGYIHWQGRLSLKTKERLAGVKKHFPAQTHLSPTSTENRDNMFYVTKEDTRIDGPWKDTDTEIYIPRQYRGLIDKLLPWQKTVWDNRDEFQPRFVNMVYDPDGNNGKSTLASLFELYGHGIDLPPCNDGEKLIQTTCNILEAENNRTPGTMFIDMPRSMDQTKLYGMYTAIEQIKKGKVYDYRYKYRRFWFDSPQVWVFANTMPVLGYMTPDRWRFWTIKDHELKPLDVTERNR